MPLNAGIQIRPLPRKCRGGGLWIPALARTTRERRGAVVCLARSAAIVRGRLQFWQAPHDFKALSRKICH
jgi:hypothetical protein